MGNESERGSAGRDKPNEHLESLMKTQEQ
jgi:hypothetical protein